ncbi:MAG: hypothetical protein SOX72_02575 [Oscillospiraceae bacterium]|nr:hypothetical protein [Oscillospiraceae bacterium]
MGPVLPCGLLKLPVFSACGVLPGAVGAAAYEQQLSMGAEREAALVHTQVHSPDMCGAF